MSDPKARLTDSDIVEADLADWRHNDGDRKSVV